MAAPHSPLPWSAVEEYPEDGPGPYGTRWMIERVTQDDGMAYGYRWLTKADAAFIVRAVNTHDALLAACKAVRQWLLDSDEPAVLVKFGHGWNDAFVKANNAVLQAIAKAEAPEGQS